MGRVAFLANVHSNATALEAVLRHIIREKTAESIFFAGNLIGWGPDTDACLSLLRAAYQRKSIIAGVHEQYALRPPNHETDAHIQSIAQWNKNKLSVDDYFLLEALPKEQHLNVGRWTVHVAYNEWDDYPLGGVNPRDGRIVAATVLHHIPKGEIVVAGCAATPAVYTLETGERMSELKLGEPVKDDGLYKPKVSYPLTSDQSFLIGVGSVGQTRIIGEDRASYVVLDPDKGKVYLHFVDYDHMKTMG